MPMRVPLWLWLAGWLCLCAGPLVAQDVVATLELSRKEPRPLWFEYVKADSGLVTLSYMSRNSSRYIGIYKYNAAFQRQWSHQFMENDQRKDIIYLGVLGNHIFIFVAEAPRGAETTEVYYYAYDLEGHLVAERVPAATLSEKQKPREVLGFVKAINKRRLYVVQQLPTTKTDKTLKVRALMFAQGQGPNFVADTTLLPYPATQLSIKQMEVANTGELYLLTKKFEDAREKTTAFAMFRILPQAPAETKLLETPLYYPENQITDLIFKLDPQGTVYLGGFFSKRTADKAHGLIYTRLTAEDNTMEATSFVPFNKEFLAKYLTRRQLSRDQALTDFYLDHIILRSDGGLLLLAEQYWVSSIAYTDAYGFISYREFYNYDDIAAFSISPNGELEWTAVIPKQQTGEYKPELSYFHAVSPTGIQFYYKARSKASGSNVFVREISYYGQVSPVRIFLQGLRAGDTFYRKACEQVTNSRALIVFAKARPRTFTMLKVALD